ncbi:MAG TPA: T9SS type A sorting domain-containing protein [Puia sp.]|nr:T9SS type A sorting domain-containing protein [Puia sp.]
MKKLYPLATLLLSTFILTSGVNAQSFTYTAERNGTWHTESGPNVWDASGEPPTNCSSCKVIIKAGVTVTLNTHITLSGGSTVQIGTDGSAAAALLIQSSGGTNWDSSFNIILPNDGSTPTNSLKVIDGISFVNAATAGTYDGVLTAFTSSGSTTYFKQLGNAPAGFVETAVASNSPAAYGTSVSGPKTLSATGTLPISLVDFDAVVNNGAVDLSWTTLLESNSNHFDIERSADGGAKWDVVGKVAAKGNSSSPTNYSFTDANPGSGTFQYRVHGYDNDGRPTLSPVKVVRTTPIASVSVFPNPAKDYVNVSIPATETSVIHIRLIGQSGQLLAEKSVTGAGGTIQSFSVSNYPPGNYLVQVVSSDGVKQVSKVVISRN